MVGIRYVIERYERMELLVRRHRRVHVALVNHQGLQPASPIRFDDQMVRVFSVPTL